MLKTRFCRFFRCRLDIIEKIVWLLYRFASLRYDKNSRQFAMWLTVRI